MSVISDCILQLQREPDYLSVKSHYIYSPAIFQRLLIFELFQFKREIEKGEREREEKESKNK